MIKKIYNNIGTEKCERGHKRPKSIVYIQIVYIVYIFLACVSEKFKKLSLSNISTKVRKKIQNEE